MRFDFRTKGEKIADTKNSKKKVSDKFPIGQLVKQRYVNSVGLISSKVSTQSSTEWGPSFYVDVLWMHHDQYDSGTVVSMFTDRLMIYKEKKVV